MKSLLVAVVALLLLSVHSLVAQDSSPRIAVGGTPTLGGRLAANFITGIPNYGSKYFLASAGNFSTNFKNDFNTEVDVNGVSDPFLRGRIIVTDDPALDLLICPNNIIARREDAGTIIHLKKLDGGVISLEIPSSLSNPSYAQWRLVVIDQSWALSDSSKGTISIIGVHGNPIEVPDKSDFIKPIDIFKTTDEATGIASYNFSYAATAVGTTSLTFWLVAPGIYGDFVADEASFTIQVDDAAAAPTTANADSSSQPLASSL